MLSIKMFKILLGGMKRKLSLGIALIGGSKIVFLDEPTSGMDPYSRRATWELLRRSKKNRVIVLTTHFMDEADFLGDRVAIMDQGEIKCCGTSLFLKNRYGVGYSLSLSKAPNFQQAAVASLVKATVGQAVALKTLPANFECEILTNAGNEISFRLPFEACPFFGGLFDKLDSSLEALGVANYGVSVTTLEEVFLRVGYGEQLEALTREERLQTARALPSRADSSAVVADQKGSDPTSRLEEENEALLDVLTSQPIDLRAAYPEELLDVSFCRHVRALLAKRWHGQKRDKKVWSWTLVYPFLIMLVSCGLIVLSAATANYPRLALTGRMFNSPNRVPFNLRAVNSSDSFDSEAFLKNLSATFLIESNILLEGENLPLSKPIVTSHDMSTYLLDTWQTYEESRYGALCFFDATSPRHLNATVFINSTAVHAVPTFFNLVSNAKLAYWQHRQAADNGTLATIATNTHPMPATAAIQTYISSTHALNMGLAFAFIPASVAALVVSERETAVKHQQLVSGLSPLAYWTANFLWDLSNFIIPGSLALFVAWLYDISGLLGEAAPAFALAILLYGASITVFTYLLSFLFRNSASAQNFMLLLYIFTGGVLNVISLILDSIPKLRATNDALKFVYRLLPNFAFSETVGNLILFTAPTVYGPGNPIWSWQVAGYPCLYMALELPVYALCVLLVEKAHSTPGWTQALWRLLTCRNEIVDSAVAPDPGLAVAIGAAAGTYRDEVTRLRQRLVENNCEAVSDDSSGWLDQDVLFEQERVLAGQADDSPVLLQRLRKEYLLRDNKVKVAVNNLTFGVKKGECFGFLGVNGAGKSTTLKMLTADETPSSGTARLNGFDLMQDQQKVRRSIGYCPQFDALLPNLTARETLTLYARIKGLPEVDLQLYVAELLQLLSLNDFADQPCGGYSGGNKRKLSVGMALVGSPAIVFLDEPSTGMDPASRRFMWRLIQATMATRSVILTTHSMDECEALCGRIGILVNGTLQCLGNAQHLKHRFGAGYQLDLHVVPDYAGSGSVHSLFDTDEVGVVALGSLPSEDSKRRTYEDAQLELVRNFVESSFGKQKVVLLEVQGTHLTFRLPKEVASLGQIFTAIETHREKLRIREYSVSETTLDQIFLHFAGKQDA
jgi:ATP-binding cassette subfamily A (ABC1) protein 3